MKHLIDAFIWEGFYLTHKFKLDWKSLYVINTLAYYEHLLMKEIKVWEYWALELFKEAQDREL